MRTAKIEHQLMLAELHLDGIKTHITIRKDKCPLYNTAYDHKVRIALSAVRSARDIFRNDTGYKQRTITTRGGSANRHGLWDCTPKKPIGWTCGFCKRKRFKFPTKISPMMMYDKDVQAAGLKIGDPISKLEEYLKKKTNTGDSIERVFTIPITNGQVKAIEHSA